MRWGIQLVGASTDKNEAIQQLQKAADHGVLLAPFATLLRAVAAFRDKNNAKGCAPPARACVYLPKEPVVYKGNGALSWSQTVFTNTVFDSTNVSAAFVGGKAAPDFVPVLHIWCKRRRLSHNRSSQGLKFDDHT